MKINSDIVNSTLSNVISSLINSGFDAAHGRTTMKEASLSILHTAVDGTSQAVEFNDTLGSDMGELRFEDVKSGIYSIVMAGISSGLNDVEETETASAQQALMAARDAALSKSREVLPGVLCDRIQSHLTASFDIRRTRHAEKGTKSRTAADLSDFAADSAELLAIKSVGGLRSAMSGEMSVTDAVETTLADVKSDISGLLFDKVQSRVSDSFDARKAKIEDKTYKHKSSQAAANFANDSAQIAASHGIDNLRGVVSGDISMTEAVELTMKETASDVSSNMANAATSKISEKLGLDFLDPLTVIETARNVKECFSEYINGQINGTQFFMKIGYDGLYQAAHAWGTAVGTHLAVSAGLHGAAAAMTVAASSTLVVAIYGELYSYAMDVFQKEIESEERLQTIRELSAEAIDVIRMERESLLVNTFMQAEHRQRVFQESLVDLSTAIDNGNIELLTEALHKITEEVGGTIQFRTFEEFDEFMQDDSLELTL